MKRLFFILFIAFLSVVTTSAAIVKSYQLTSPDGRLRVTVSAGDGLSYTLEHDGDMLLDKSPISMFMTDGTVFGGVQPVKKVSRRSVDQNISPVIYKKSVVRDNFNEVTLNFKTFSLVFRAYDDGMAYRFVSHLKESYEVEMEFAGFNFTEDWNMWTAYVCQHTESLESQYYNSFENRYEYAPLTQWNKERLAFLPLA